MSASTRENLARMPAAERRAYLGTLSADEVASLLAGEWPYIARPEQRPDWSADWSVLLWMTGRGWGKTLAGAQATLERIKWLSAQGVARPRWALVGRRLKDVRRVMVEGETGLQQIVPPSLLLGGSWERSWSRGEVLLRLSNGAEIQGYSSESPGDLRGPQHHGGWVDEIAKLRDARLGDQADTTWFNLEAGMRLPPDPRIIVTGTPATVRVVRDLVGRADRGESVLVVGGATHENLRNLGGRWREFVDRYEGTRLGAQELYGQLLGDLGGMFTRADLLEEDRLLDAAPTGPGLRRARAWDLASSRPSAAYTDPDWTAGARVSLDPHRRLYVVEHMERFRETPGARDDRMRQVAERDGIRTVHVEQYHGAAGLDVIAALRRGLSGVARVEGVKPRGTKAERAEVVSSAVEQGRVAFVAGPWLDDLVDELEEFPEGAHDDQVDALALAFSALGQPTPPRAPAAGQAAGVRVPQARQGSSLSPAARVSPGRR